VFFDPLAAIKNEKFSVSMRKNNFQCLLIFMAFSYKNWFEKGKFYGIFRGNWRKIVEIVGKSTI
jgi:hypothetical protein